ncbi:hemolytic domain-containing protein [Carex littledalei]|uniref:Hemolytic domain-containing protein n=1 Tax=Carex littledalei TaxID=544730 RepID=A0A833R5S8_9POAL|nr:hemolytic domain-containing protein [Carex littledalei]
MVSVLAPPPRRILLLSLSTLSSPSASRPKLRQRRRLPLHFSASSRNQYQVPEEEEEVQDLGVKIALSLLIFYKREISPLLPRSCRYVPTCSQYSMDAYKKYGFVKGSVLTVWRICRCNPFGNFSMSNTDALHVLVPVSL